MYQPALRHGLQTSFNSAAGFMLQGNREETLLGENELDGTCVARPTKYRRRWTGEK